MDPDQHALDRRDESRAPRSIPVAKTHTVYAATTTNFWQSANAGKTWTASALPTKTSDIQELIADKSVAGRVYAVDSVRTVYRSDNCGKSWNAGVGVAKAGDNFETYPTAVAPDPSQSATLYAGMGSGLWKSANSAASWSEAAIDTQPRARSPTNRSAGRNRDLRRRRPIHPDQLQLYRTEKCRHELVHGGPTRIPKMAASHSPWPRPAPARSSRSDWTIH